MANIIDRFSKLYRKTAWSIVGLGNNSDSNTTLLYQESEGLIKSVNSPAVIEPKWGYIIREDGQLIEDSLTPNFYHDKSNWRLAMPSIRAVYAAMKKKENTVRYPVVISLRHWWEWNYYHFYLDVLGKLALLSDAGLFPEIPLVIGRYAIELPYVTEILKTGDLKHLKWIIQDNSFVHADRIIYLQTKQTYKKRIDLIMDWMKVPENNNTDQNRIFLTRRGNATRQISNNKEVSKLLREFKFQEVDTNGMKIQNQINIFNRTGYLVGIHGAGMTNIIFRRSSMMRVLELHPSVLRNTDHENIATEYGYFWDTLAGEPENKKKYKTTDFNVPIGSLVDKIRNLVNET